MSDADTSQVYLWVSSSGAANGYSDFSGLVEPSVFFCRSDVQGERKRWNTMQDLKKYQISFNWVT